MSRHTSDAKSRSSKKAAAIHAKLRAEVYREIETKADATDKQSRKRAASQSFHTRGE